MSKLKINPTTIGFNRKHLIPQNLKMNICFDLKATAVGHQAMTWQWVRFCTLLLLSGIFGTISYYKISQYKISRLLKKVELLVQLEFKRSRRRNFNHYTHVSENIIRLYLGWYLVNKIKYLKQKFWFGCRTRCLGHVKFFSRLRTCRFTNVLWTVNVYPVYIGL